MNRRQKIIISVTGIFLVLLILMGLTYAYFLTRINGNANPNSISVTTENLQLDWIDGTDKIIDSTDVIIPGDFESSITFSVKNNGNATIEDYGVIVDDLRIKWASNVEGTNQVQNVDTHLEHPEDMELTITCFSDKDTCDGKKTYLPTTNAILLTNDIESGETHEYTVTLEYVESGSNQSADMNKTITARLDIVDTNNTSVLAGRVSNYVAGDYVQSNSTTRISSIDKNGNYKIVGLEPGKHTVRLYDSSNTAKGSKLISIKNDTSRIEINIDRSTGAYTLGAPTNNPYNEGTLAYEIINNAMNTSLVEESALGYAYFRETPITIPGKQSTVLYEVIDPTSYYERSAYESYYWVYGDDVTFDGYYHLVNPQVGKYSDIYKTLKGKYSSVYHYYTEAEANEAVTENSFGFMYKVGEGSTSEKINIGEVTYKELGVAESTLSITEDSYSETTNVPSYYYRGNVKNNYVLFNNMCWRIVRIEGDGSVKITLSKEGLCSTITSSDTTSAFIGNGDFGTEYDYYDAYFYRADFYNLEEKTTSMKYILEDWLKGLLSDGVTKRFTDNIKNKLKSTSLCSGTSRYNVWERDSNYDDGGYIEPYEVWDYESYERLYNQKTATLICKYYDNMEIFPLTADEVAFAGSIASTSNINNYLVSNAAGVWWTYSLARHTKPYDHRILSESVLMIYGNGKIGFDDVFDEIFSWDKPIEKSIRPAVSLIPGIEIQSGGTGTIDNPYVIK